MESIRRRLSAIYASANQANVMGTQIDGAMPAIDCGEPSRRKPLEPRPRGACSLCGWRGSLNTDGNLRKHRCANGIG